MIDSLGGILTKGLLGNGPTSLILGFFNLGLFDVTVVVTPVKGHPQVWPGLPPTRDNEQEDDRYLTFKIRIKEKEITKVYRISNGQATVVIKLNESVKVFIEKTTIIANNFLVKPIKRIFKIKIKD